MFFESLRLSLKSSFIKRVEAEINQIWDLGRNVLIGWARVDEALVFISCSNDHLPTALAPYKQLPTRSGEISRPLLATLARDKRFGLHRFAVTEQDAAQLRSGEVIDRILHRYGLVLAENRASVLFDIVGYSKLEPLQQVAQLNSLSYSVNVAHKRMLERGLKIDLARSTTGDGFYMWNRKPGAEANLRLYALTMLALADNALALTHAVEPVVPHLRTAFDVGSHFEFYQAVGFTPETREYIVGDTTIRLARYLAQAQSGQVVIGEFETPSEDGAPLDTEAFLDKVRALLATMTHLPMSSAEASRIQVYLSGRRAGEGVFVPTRYLVEDKHGNRFPVYNARCVIDRHGADKIFIGLRHPEIAHVLDLAAVAA
jgi:hypothetical protein